MTIRAGDGDGDGVEVGPLAEGRAEPGEAAIVVAVVDDDCLDEAEVEAVLQSSPSQAGLIDDDD